MSDGVLLAPDTTRASLVKRGRHLEYFTIGYNTLEGLIAVVAALTAGSIALVGFGFDSLNRGDFWSRITLATAFRCR
jgi:hypothetical protein